MISTSSNLLFISTACVCVRIAYVCMCVCVSSLKRCHNNSPLLRPQLTPCNCAAERQRRRRAERWMRGWKKWWDDDSGWGLTERLRKVDFVIGKFLSLKGVIFFLSALSSIHLPPRTLSAWEAPGGRWRKWIQQKDLDNGGLNQLYKPQTSSGQPVKDASLKACRNTNHSHTHTKIEEEKQKSSFFFILIIKAIKARPFHKK